MQNNQKLSHTVSSALLISLAIATAASAIQLACHMEPYVVPKWYQNTASCPTSCTIDIQVPGDITCVASTVSYAFCNNYDQYGRRCTDVALLYTYLGVCQSTESGYNCLSPSGEPIGTPRQTLSYIPCYQGYDAELCPEV